MCHADAITKVFTVICFVCQRVFRPNSVSKRIFNFMKNLNSTNFFFPLFVCQRGFLRPKRTLEIVKYFYIFFPICVDLVCLHWYANDVFHQHVPQYIGRHARHILKEIQSRQSSIDKITITLNFNTFQIPNNCIYSK